MRTILLIGLLLTITHTLSSQYVEPVRFFKNSPNTSGNDDGKNWMSRDNRGFHIGFDVFLKDASSLVQPGEPVFAILDGTIVENRGNVQGFGGAVPDKTGGAIVIEHVDDNGNVFHALYGHLNQRTNKDVGDRVVKSEKIGVLNDYKVNGTKATHLHFGIWTDGNWPPETAWGYANRQSHWVMPRDYLNTNCNTPPKPTNFEGAYKNTSRNASLLMFDVIKKKPSYNKYNNTPIFSRNYNLQNVQKRTTNYGFFAAKLTISNNTYYFIAQKIDQDGKVLIGPLIKYENGKYLTANPDWVKFISYGNTFDLELGGKFSELNNLYTFNK